MTAEPCPAWKATVQMAEDKGLWKKGLQRSEKKKKKELIDYMFLSTKAFG